MLTLIVYDIADNRRRTKLAKFLEGYGHRVQESVFECFLSFEEMQKLYQKVLKRVHPTEDNVRFYWITPRALSKSLVIGSSPPKPPPSAYIL